MDLGGFRAGLDDWLARHAGELAPPHRGAGSLDEQLAQLAKVKRLAFDAGWMRHGWPERVGGLGGSTLLRAYLGEALTTADLVEPGIYSMTEVLAPTLIDYASPELAAAMVPRLLRGDETWCQG
ncbi:MAG TPA: acyl-CoA dehydrogenase family protein, partial [Acidimicrobiales bacterium]|nr:acyl-CoA dehydrogenase family protein [Acidimicrobiales bacterium]